MNLERLRVNEAKLRQLYGFLARTFPESKEWPLFIKSFKSTAANPKAELDANKGNPPSADAGAKPKPVAQKS